MKGISTINSSNAPAAIGPYSQAKEIENLLFISGQIPLNPVSGEVQGTGIVEQTKQVMKNITAILEEAGLTFDSVLKTTCFLANMDDFGEFNKIYAEYFINKPARSCIAVKELPKKVLVEVEVIAQSNKSTKNSNNVKKYNFDEILDRSKLSTSKWEYEKDRKNRKDLLCFGTADMDFKSAEPILNALYTVVENGHFGYPYKRNSYYEAIINYFKKHFNWKIEKESIANSVAVYPSFQALIEGLSKEGDEIIYNTPVHHIFKEIISATGRIPVENPLTIKDNRYVFDFEDLKAKISPKTSLLILCSPQNPMGRVWTREELNQMMDICLRNNIKVISDEVYFGLVNKNKQHIPIASLSKEASMNTVTCLSPSKSFNLTGIKHSLVISENKQFLEVYRNELKKNNEYYGESIFGHAATEAAFSSCEEWSEQLMGYVQGNYNTVYEFMRTHLPKVKVYEPEATYFVWMDFNFLNLSNAELTSFFEDKANIIVSQGYHLGTGGDGFIRLNVACPRSILIQGLERIRTAYGELVR